MRRTVPILAALLLLSATLLPALSRSDFDRVVDFGVTLKTLSAAAEGKAPLPGGRMVVLTGTVSDITIVNRERATFKARIELTTGEWIGLEDVKAYSCYVDFAGGEYFNVFPARAPREPVPGTIVSNARALVVGRVVGIVDASNGEKRVLLDGAWIRSIE
ncbi:MAG TPA: hypothetical protein VHE79_08900 [Spirochaetia bacterium]